MILFKNMTELYINSCIIIQYYQFFLMNSLPSSLPFYPPTHTKLIKAENFPFEYPGKEFSESCFALKHAHILTHKK